MNPKFQDLAFDAVIPSALLFNENIEPSAIKLYAFIRGLSRLEGYCYATNQYLAECMNCDERTITRLIKSLSDEKFIEIETYKENMNWQRHIFVGVSLKESLRKDKIVYPPRQNQPPPPTKLSTNKGYIIEDKKDCLSPPPVGPEEPIKSIKKIDTAGRETFFELDQVFRKAVAQNKDWRTSEIQEAWRILVKYSGRVNDPMAFIEGTIKNFRIKQNLEKIKENNHSCQRKKEVKTQMGIASKTATQDQIKELERASQEGPLAKAYREITQRGTLDIERRLLQV